MTGPSPTPVDIAVNPNNTDQRWVMWGTGRFDSHGGAPAIAFTSGSNWFTRTDQPVGLAMHILDHATGEGYALDYQGGFQSMNGAPGLGDGNENQDVTALGVPYTAGGVRKYADWSWDPGGTGRALVLDMYGQLYAFQGANLPPRSGPRWPQPLARKLKVRWENGQPTHALTQDIYGGLHGDYAVQNNVQPPLWWFPRDGARDFEVVEWATSPKVFALDLHGGVGITGEPAASGGPYRKADVARCLHVLSASNPRRIIQVWSGGQLYEYVSSATPTVTAGGTMQSPADPTTDTTRPILAWDYSDPDRDSQNLYELYLFTQGYVTANPSAGTNPAAHAANAVIATSGSGAGIRGIEPDADLPNGDYVFYVRVTDVAGRQSAWSSYSWTQQVVPPGTPTGMSAVHTSDPEKWHVALAVNTTADADYVRCEFSDDNGATWWPVRGAEAVPRTSTTTAVDYDIPIGPTRLYRAVKFSVAPRTASEPTAAVPVTSPNHREHVLTAVSDPNLGGYVRVVEAPSWTREAKAGVLEGAGAKHPTVISDGVPKARKQTLVVETNSEAEYDRLTALLDSDSTLVYREPFGHVVYCRVVGTITWSQKKRLPYEDEPFPLGHRHNVSIPLVEVAQPAPGAL